VPYRWMDLESDEAAEGVLQALGVAACETPIVIAGEGVLRNPSNAELAATIGLGARGAPPADLAALADIVAAVAALMRVTPELVEIDLNPVVVHGTGRGARALDALVAIAPKG